MKLFEAILAGCDRRAQGFRRLFTRLPNGQGYSCALGAAFESTFGINEETGKWRLKQRMNALRERYPVLERNAPTSCEVPGCSPFWVHSLNDLIVHLNDDHRWPREKIAMEVVRRLEEEQ